jgi:hypothetical protein
MTQKKPPLTYTFLYWGAFVQGDFVRGLMSWGILSGGLCPGGFCPRPKEIVFILW